MRLWIYPRNNCRVPHISLVFREMWDTAGPALKLLADLTNPAKAGSRPTPQVYKRRESHPLSVSARRREWASARSPYQTLRGHADGRREPALRRQKHAAVGE